MQNNNSFKKKENLPQFTENPFTLYCHYVYRFLGRSLLERKKFREFFYSSIYNKRYEEILKKANLKILPEEYFISIFLSLIFTLVIFVFVTLGMLFVSTIYSVITFYVGIGASFLVGVFMYNYPVVVSNQRGTEIDAAIPFLLPYMKILGRELNLSKIIGLIDEFVIYKEIKAEFKKIRYYSEFLGYDIHSSIREAMASCPSKQLSDLLNDLVTISNSGGDIYSYLDRKLDNLNSEIEGIEKKNIDTLLIYSQIYVVLLLIAPLFFSIMTSILNLVEFTAGASPTGGSQNSIFSTLVLLLILPFAYAGFMMLIYYSKPLYSRLEPIDKKEK